VKLAAAILALCAGCSFLPLVGSAAAGAAVSSVLAPSCEKPAPAHWPLCRDACAKQGDATAAVVGPADASEKPQCMCAPKGDT